MATRKALTVIEGLVQEVPSGDTIAGTSPTFYVERFRTSGMSDKAATAAAYAAADATLHGGNVVWDPTREYDVEDWFIEPVYSANKRIILGGSSPAVLKFSKERGTPSPRPTLLTTGGTLGVAAYSYRLALITSAGDMMFGRPAKWSVTTGTTNRISLEWDLPTTCRGATVTGVKIYGRTAGSELLMATLGLVTTWTDDGSITPAGALPAGNESTLTYAVNPIGFGSHVVVRNLIIIGPATTFAYGDAGSHMCFINLRSRAVMENVVLRRWYLGANFSGDHTRCINVQATQCWYGFGCFNQTTAGDNVMEGCDLSGQAWASFGIGTDSFMAGVTRSGHMGVAPYSVFIEPGPKTTSSTSNWAFYGASFEVAGNGHFWDENYNATLDGTLLSKCGGFNYNVAYAAPGRSVVAAFRASQVSNWRIDSDTLIGASDPPSPPVWFDAGYLSGNEWNGCLIPKALIGQVANFDLSFAVTPLRLRTLEFVGAVYQPAVAIIAGQLVELTANSTVQPHNTGTILGVALNTVSAYDGGANRRGCVVAGPEADNIPLLTVAGPSILTTDVLVPNPADPSRVMAASSSSPGQAIIGRLATGSTDGSAGSVSSAKVRLYGVTGGDSTTNSEVVLTSRVFG